MSVPGLRSIAIAVILLLASSGTAAAQIVFQVDSTRSGVTVVASLSAPVIGSASDSDSTAIAGSLVVELEPGTVRITEMHLSLSKGLSLKFDYGILGSISAATSASAISLDLIEPGEPAVLQGNAFSQSENQMNLEGLLQLTGKGALSGVPPSEPQEIDDTTSTSISGTFDVQDGSYQMALPVDFRSALDLGTATAQIRLRGTVYASAVSPVSSRWSELPQTFEASVYPYPTSGSLHLSLSLMRSQQVEVDVFDVQGRLVTRLSGGFLAAGSHELTSDVSQLRSGAYFLVIRGESIRKALPVLVVR